ncbi:MAG: hypothetical protein HN348_06295, partial [Proteobacteria bacterium]|nr:hypothetical protein [Pseudomonadota bacterium]
MLVLLLASALALGGMDFVRWADRRAPPVQHPQVAQDYRFTGEFFPLLGEMVRERSGVVEAEMIGLSAGNRAIWAFHVSEPGVPVEETALIFAGIHALEWISTEVALELLHELIQVPPRGIRVTVIPLLNPDGRAHVEDDLVNEVNRYRRSNSNGADINRDFAHNREVKAVWSKVIPAYYDPSPGSLSQPESQALNEIMRREGYSRAASLHAFGGFFYYPWSGLYERPPAEDRLKMVALGRAMEKAQGAFAYRTRQLGRWGFFFRAHGSEIDHMYGEYGTMSFLV